MFETNWIFFTLSDGNIADEKIIRKEYTTVMVMERLLLKQVKSLKEMEAIAKD